MRWVNDTSTHLRQFAGDVASGYAGGVVGSSSKIQLSASSAAAVINKNFFIIQPPA